MPKHFAEFLAAGSSSPGVFLVKQQTPRASSSRISYWSGRRRRQKTGRIELSRSRCVESRPVEGRSQAGALRPIPRPENCLDVIVDSKARAILVWRADQKLLPPATARLGIGVVSTVNQALDILTELDQAPERPGLVDRMKRLLGLKEPLNA